MFFIPSRTGNPSEVLFSRRNQACYSITDGDLPVETSRIVSSGRDPFAKRWSGRQKWCGFRNSDLLQRVLKPNLRSPKLASGLAKSRRKALQAQRRSFFIEGCRSLATKSRSFFMREWHLSPSGD